MERKQLEERMEEKIKTLEKEIQNIKEKQISSERKEEEWKEIVNVVRELNENKEKEEEGKRYNE